MKTKNTTSISIRSIALLLVLVLVVGITFVVPSSAASSANVGKLVDYFKANNGVAFTLNANSRFFLAEEPTGELLQTVQLAQRQFAADGIPSADKTPMDIVYGDTAMLRAGDIFIQIANDDDIGAEGYKIIADTYATVIAEDVDGLLYGLNMLQKHFRNAQSNSIYGFTTYDTPDTKERTVQLDCARKYFTVEYICNFVREMSWMGYNTLQLHFSEDGGFRADLWDDRFFASDYKGTYKPENDFTWLCGSHVQSWVKEPYRTDPDAGNFLSTDDLLQIIDVCKEYHIDIIPSFDSPAHMDYLTWKFEKHYNSNTSYSFKYNGKTYKASDCKGCINYLGKTGAATPSWPYYTTIDIVDGDGNDRGDIAQAFVLSIYKDMADFFKIYAGSTKFNIGADEVNLSYTGSWAYSNFPTYINKINTLLNSKGYTSRMFNDFIKAGYIDKFADNIEILYWNSPYHPNNGTIAEPNIMTVAQMVNDGRTLYNCIQTGTYYVLRIVAPDADTTTEQNKDARDPTNTNWTFYYSTEDRIFDYWYPADISEKGNKSEDVADVPAGQLGGAYFLTWNDYAAVNTEVEVWNGVVDRSGSINNGKYTYSLRNRMWSNTIKMWNADINKSIDYATYATIRDTLGDFPGLGTGTNACSTKTTLPAATNPIQLADHTVLTAALAHKIAQGSYSDESYAAYETAYNAAILMNNKNNATAEELGTALSNLKKAEAALVIKTNTVTILRKTTINGIIYTVDTLSYSVPSANSTFDLFIPNLNGYKYLDVDKGTFVPAGSGDGSGHLSGKISGNVEIVMWYENQVDVSRLNNLLEEAITQQGNYTDASWRVYTAALNAAKKFTLTVDTQQSTVLALVQALEEARTALVVDAKITFIKVEKLAGSFNKDGQIGLYIQTSSNVPGLVITKEGTPITPDSISAEVQTLNNGDVVKNWLVFLPADAIGTFTYTVTFGATSASITITVA